MKLDKKQIAACALAGVMLLSLSSCSLFSKKQEYSYDAYKGSGQVESYFTDTEDPEKILSSLKNINLSETFDTFLSESKKSGQKVSMKTEENDADSTAIETYYMGKTKLCSVYKGYGEESWEMYTTDENGNSITVQYVEQSSDNPSVMITENKGDSKAPAYSINFEDLDSKLLYGAKNISLTFSSSVESFDQILTYSINLDGNKYVSRIGTAYYTDSHGNYLRSWYDEENKQVDDYVLVEAINSSNANILEHVDVNTVKSIEGFKDFEMIIGQHKNYVDENGALYIKGDLYFVFDNKDAASAFSTANGLDQPDDSYGVDCCSVRINDTMLKVANDCKSGLADLSVEQFLTYEWDDPEFKSLKFNTSGEVLGFSGERFLSYN